MKLELQSPFKEKWRRGYLVKNKERRQHVVLYNTHWDRTTISYARYLMGVKLGYEVPQEYEVDHINNDKTDDRIENLQLLTGEENRRKSARPRTTAHGTLTSYRYCKCVVCKKAKSEYAKIAYQKRKNKV